MFMRVWVSIDVYRSLSVSMGAYGILYLLVYAYAYGRLWVRGWLGIGLSVSIGVCGFQTPIYTYEYPYKGIQTPFFP